MSYLLQSPAQSLRRQAGADLPPRPAPASDPSPDRMTQDRTDQDQMGYEALAQEALRGVVKASLKRAAGPGGLPGAHHFYVTFKTRAPGVSIPPELVEKYPDEMTIVIQHQFWDLAPGETFFSVTLKLRRPAQAAVDALPGGDALLRSQRAVPAAVRAVRRRCEHSPRGRAGAAAPARASGRRPMRPPSLTSPLARRPRSRTAPSPMATDPRSSPWTSSGRSSPQTAVTCGGSGRPPHL